MRTTPSRLLRIVAVAALTVAGSSCGDDSDDGGPSNVPGVSSHTGDSGEGSDVSGTSLPSSTDPQVTPVPNPNAGGGGSGGDAGTGSAP